MSKDAFNEVIAMIARLLKALTGSVSLFGGFPFSALIFARLLFTSFLFNAASAYALIALR